MSAPGEGIEPWQPAAIEGFEMSAGGRVNVVALEQYARLWRVMPWVWQEADEWVQLRDDETGEQVRWPAFEERFGDRQEVRVMVPWGHVVIWTKPTKYALMDMYQDTTEITEFLIELVALEKRDRSPGRRKARIAEGVEHGWSLARAKAAVRLLDKVDRRVIDAAANELLGRGEEVQRVAEILGVTRQAMLKRFPMAERETVLG